jgi:hypothetical protein
VHRCPRIFCGTATVAQQPAVLASPISRWDQAIFLVGSLVFYSPGGRTSILSSFRSREDESWGADLFWVLRTYHKFMAGLFSRET